MSLKGTVTISLDDYHALLETHEKNIQIRENLKDTTRELAVFLSYLTTRENIKNHIEAFNMQSKSCKIMFEGNRAIIELRNNDGKNNNKT